MAQLHWSLVRNGKTLHFRSGAASNFLCEPPGKGNPTSLDHILMNTRWLNVASNGFRQFCWGAGFCQVSECLLSSHSNPCRYKALAQARTVVKGAENFPYKHGPWMFLRNRQWRRGISWTDRFSWGQSFATCLWPPKIFDKGFPNFLQMCKMDCSAKKKLMRCRCSKLYFFFSFRTHGCSLAIEVDWPFFVFPSPCCFVKVGTHGNSFRRTESSFGWATATCGFASRSCGYPHSAWGAKELARVS